MINFRCGRAENSGFSLLEIMIAAILVSTIILGATTLTSSQVDWTLDLNDRLKAMSLAGNALNLVEFAYRDYFSSLPQQADGGHILYDPDIVLPEGELILGDGLFDWINEKRAPDKFFEFSLKWFPVPPDNGMNPSEHCGQIVCTIGWLSAKGDEKWLQVARVVSS